MFMVKIVYKENVPSKHFLFEDGEKFAEKYARTPGMDISNAAHIICKEVPQNLVGLDRALIFNKMLKVM